MATLSYLCYEFLQDKRPQKISVFTKDGHSFTGDKLTVLGETGCAHAIRLDDTKKKKSAYVEFECVSAIGRSLLDEKDDIDIPVDEWLPPLPDEKLGANKEQTTPINTEYLG